MRMKKVECRIQKRPTKGGNSSFCLLHSAFTLLEVMLAMALLSLIIAAVYATWAGIVKAAKTGTNAAVVAQRERATMRVLQQAIVGAQLFVANPTYYSFEADNGDATTLSFVSKLPESFPRSGKFKNLGGSLLNFDVRRVVFSVEAGPDRNKQLVLRQNPIFMEMDEDEQTHPVVLADNVAKLSLQFWDTTANDWTDTWLLTNQLPKMVKVFLQLKYATARGENASPVLTTIVALPTAGVQATWQQTSGGNGSGGRGGGTNGGSGGRGGISVIGGRATGEVRPQ